MSCPSPERNSHRQQRKATCSTAAVASASAAAALPAVLSLPTAAAAPLTAAGQRVRVCACFRSLGAA